jgi:hypothetical protein
MDLFLKKYLAVGSSIILTTTTLLGIPFKSYVNQIHEQACIDEQPPKYWTKSMAKAYAYGYMRAHYPTWGKGEWRALVKLWGKESAWDHTADNPTSSAYGIAQVLNTKPGTPAPLQIEKGLSYIQHRYDKPSIAWSHWRKHRWY